MHHNDRTAWRDARHGPIPGSIDESFPRRRGRWPDQARVPAAGHGGIALIRNAATRALKLALVLLPFAGPGQARAAVQDACALAAAPAADFALRVPFDVVDGRIYVQVRVDGRGPFRFAVDTGASGSARADASLISALGLAPGKPAANSDGVRTAASGTVHLDSVELGGLSRTGLDVITRDYNARMSKEAALSGILGRGFFEGGLLVIDYPARTLSFSRSLALPPRAEHVLHYERAFRVPVSIGAVQAEGNLDTGANVAFVLPKALYDRVSGAPLEEAGRGRLANTRIGTGRATVHGPFRIGAVSLSDAEVRVADEYPELLVGAHALRHFVIMIDQRSRSVALCDPSGHEASSGAHPDPDPDPDPNPNPNPAGAAP